MNVTKILKKITDLRKDDKKTLVELDAMGLLLAPDENFKSYKKRIKKLFTHLSELEKELEENNQLRLFDVITVYKDRRINSEILKEAAELNKKFYEFEIGWVPGFFLLKSLGLLWGGCAISFPEDSLSIFLIRANFATKQKWLFYKRNELLAHELCHIARMPLHDKDFEEHFAYRLSPSRLRRYMGNCFQTTWDAIFFIIPFFLLTGAQALQTFLCEWLPIFPFWILIAIYPAFLLIRNQISRNQYFKAKSNLEKVHVKNPLPILFRCTKIEIYTMAAFQHNLLGLQEWIGKKTRTELRWNIMDKRFMSK
jgi:predicted metal-dependent hydrolase